MNRGLVTGVHNALEKVKQELHEHFGPEVGNVATKAVDNAHVEIDDLFADNEQPAEKEEKADPVPTPYDLPVSGL